MSETFTAAVVQAGSIAFDTPATIGEIILTAELDLAEITRGTFDFDPVGHYAGPDVFTLTVDERRKDPVVFEKDRPAE